MVNTLLFVMLSQFQIDNFRGMGADLGGGWVTSADPGFGHGG